MVSVEKVMAELLEEVRHRYYGKYRGFVVDNADPQHLGRLKVRVPSVFGDDVVTGWALPCVPYGGAADQGFLFIPEKEAGVWVEFEEGDPEFPTWTGTFWSAPNGDSELSKPNDIQEGKNNSEVQDPPTRKIIKTRKGHTIQFEDKSDEEAMVLIFEGAHKHMIVMNQDGITIADGKNAGNKVVMNSDGISLQDSDGNKIITKSSGISIESVADVKITGTNITLEAKAEVTIKGTTIYLNP